jgi:hypothetical protein
VRRREKKGWRPGLSRGLKKRKGRKGKMGREEEKGWLGQREKRGREEAFFLFLSKFFSNSFSNF